MVLKHFVISTAALGYCLSLAAAFVIPGPRTDGFQLTLKEGELPEQDATSWPGRLIRPVENLEDWISREKGLSFRYLLDNIAPEGVNTRGCSVGTVIASPSKAYPNYFYQWVRDAAITVQGIIDEYGKTEDADLKEVVEHYVAIQRVIQDTINPSGGFSNGGLGEPKFMVDGTPFLG